MRSNSDVAGRLVDLGVATLHESRGRRGLLLGIRLLVGEPFAGRAVTVGLPAGDNLGVHLALEAAEDGSVVCVGSAGAGLYGVVGDLLLEAARARGVAAYVIDDGIRDLATLAAPPSIAARGVTARGTVKNRLRRAVGADVVVGAVLVRSGDWLVGDADGVCVLPERDLEQVVQAAEARVVREDDVRGRVRAAETTRSVLGLPRNAPPSIP